MQGRGLFGSAPVGAVTLVETPVSQWYVRRAQVTALVAGLAADALATAGLSVFCPLLLAVVLGALAGVLCGLVAGVLVRIWPVVRVLWWWLIEITTGAFVVGGPVALAHATAWWVALPVTLLLAAACVVVGPVRRRLVAWSWCLVVRHRLRLSFARLVRGSGSGGSRPGLLPLVLWVRSTPAGERVWLWLRPGLELLDLDGKTGQIAVTCWAGGVRVAGASQRFAALVRVDVSRRDPLTGLVPSPLSLLIPRLRNNDADVPVSPAVPLVGLDLADVDEPAQQPPSRGGRR
jgi:hypothetical protein